MLSKHPFNEHQLLPAKALSRLTLQPQQLNTYAQLRRAPRELPESSQSSQRLQIPNFLPKTQPILHPLLRWGRQPKIDLFSSKFNPQSRTKDSTSIASTAPVEAATAVMATMTVAGTDKNQLKWHQKKWQLWPVVVMAAATATILTIITATMAAVAGSGDGGGESCDGSGGFGGGKGSGPQPHPNPQ